jgi:hypothetical protein
MVVELLRRTRIPLTLICVFWEPPACLVVRLSFLEVYAPLMSVTVVVSNKQC